MGTAERKIEDKERLRSLILQAAKKLFIEKGIEHTTMRSIADSVRYSVGTVYVYFKDKNAILHELHTQGFIQLGGKMQVLGAVSEPMERLKAMGRAYISFAMENPDMYDLMFSMKAPMEFLSDKCEDDWDEGKGTFDGLRMTVAECIAHGYFKGHQTEPLAFAIWSTVHGMCALKIADRIRGLRSEDPTEVVMEAYEEFVRLIDR